MDSATTFLLSELDTLRKQLWAAEDAEARAIGRAQAYEKLLDKRNAELMELRERLCLMELEVEKCK